MALKFSRLANFCIWRILIWWNFVLTMYSLTWPDLFSAWCYRLHYNYLIKSCDETIYLDINYWQKFAVLEGARSFSGSICSGRSIIPFLLTVTLLWRYRLCHRLKINEQTQFVTTCGTLLNAYNYVYL